MTLTELIETYRLMDGSLFERKEFKPEGGVLWTEKTNPVFPRAIDDRSGEYARLETMRSHIIQGEITT